MALVHLSAVAYSVRKHLATQGIAISLGHTQQLVAAALGHNNLASFQASGEDPGLARASDIVLDPERLESRAADLQQDPDAFGKALAASLEEHCPNATLYDNHEDWLIDIEDHFAHEIVSEASVNSQVAMTNGTFPRTDVELQELWGDFDAFDGSDVEHHFEGIVTVDQDEDRTYWGHEIDVSATLTVKRFGRRLFGQCDLELRRAQLRWLGESSST